MNKKRKKVTRMRGSHTHSRGFKKKARGSGHRGGVGMAGTGKRADQRKTLVLNTHKGKYFGSDKVLRRKQALKLNVINLRDIILNLQSHLIKGDVKESNGLYHLTFKNHKILGQGNVDKKLIISASSFSESAKEKIEKAGGEAILLGNDSPETEEPTEKPAPAQKKKTTTKKKTISKE